MLLLERAGHQASLFHLSEETAVVVAVVVEEEDKLCAAQTTQGTRKMTIHIGKLLLRIRRTFCNFLIVIFVLLQ